MSLLSRHRLAAAVLLSALLIAGVASFYASSHPDGLNKVAQQTGFAKSEQRSAAADGPFAGYATKGVQNPRLSRGVAGISGAALVLVIGSGLFWVIRRRPARDTDSAASSVSKGS